MKQLLPLFLFLLPCIAWAQYPSNGNQKITLGEQTTADGLIYRGVAATDTVRKPSIDTMAYMVLDTTTNIMWHYKKATSNAWLRLNLLPSDTASMLTNYWRSGRFSGILPVVNGGTNTTTLTANKVMVGNGTSGVITPTDLRWDNTNNRLGIGNIDPLAKLHVKGGGVASNINNVDSNSVFRFDLANPAISLSIGYADPIDVSYIQGSNNVNETGTAILLNPYGGFIGIGLNGNPTQQLHVFGNARITAMNAIGDIGADANGVLQAATSDMNLKNTIENSPFGLNEILLLNAVTFLYNDTNRKLDSDVKEVGFIAQDVFDIIPNAVSSTGTGDLQLDYRAITATLVKAIQEQNALIKALEQRIINLENK
jgi:hypothetical protein